jgi:hypothetical protein
VKLLGHSQPRLRLLLVISELLLIAAFAFMASQSQMILLLFLPLGVGFVLIFLKWPALGIMVAAVAGMFVPYLGPSGLNVTMILVALLLGLWLLDIIVRKNELQLVTSRCIWPLLSFLVVAIISFGVGQLPWFSFVSHAPLGAQLGGLSIIVLSVGTFVLVANRVTDIGWLKLITLVFLAFAAFWIMGRSVLPEFGLRTRNLLQPVGSTFYIWVVALAFSQAVFNRDLRPAWRWALGGLVAITIYITFFLKFADKSGWIPLFFVMGVIGAFRYKRALLLMIPAAGLAALYLTTAVVGTEDYSFSTRLDAWMIMAQIIKINPILGLGFANYYWYTPLFPIRGYAVSFNSHNNYVDIVAQTGLLGLVCFLLFLWEIGRLGWHLRSQVPAGFAQAYVYGALGGLAGTVVIGMLGDWVLPFFYNIGLNGFRTSLLGWLFLGGLVSIEQMVMSQSRITAQK